MQLDGYGFYSGEQNSRWKIPLYVLCVILLTLNGLNNTIINSIAFLCVVSYVVLSRGKDVLLAYPIVFIFMGFSNLNMNIIGASLDISTAANIIYLLMLLKLLYSEPFIKVKNGSDLFFIVLAICSLNILVTNKLSQAVFMAAKLFVVYDILFELNEEKDERVQECSFTEKFIIALFLVIIGEVIYGVLFPVASSDSTWRAAQFGGVKDPNNLSLHCCLLFALTTIINPNAVAKPLKRFIEILMPVIVFASISFTGITMISVLLIVGLWKQFNGIKKVVVTFVLALIATMASFINYANLLTALTNSNQSTVAAFAQRISLMLMQYRTGNYERLTSGRSSLWERYFDVFQNERISLQLFGSSGNLSHLIRQFGTASHNIYIDFLISYGFIGGFFISLLTLSDWLYKIRDKRYTNLIVNIAFAITFFSRSFDLSVFVLYVLL